MTVETVETVTTAVVMTPQGPAELLRTVALFEDTSRQPLPVLQSVRIVSDGKRITAIATDRYALAEASFETTEHQPFSVLVNAKGLAAALKATVSARSSMLRITPTEDGTLTLDNFETSYRVPATFGEFPRVEHIILTDETADSVPYGAIGINAAILAKLAKVSKRGALRFQLNPHGASRPMLVTVIGESNLRIVVMPRRVD